MTNHHPFTCKERALPLPREHWGSTDPVQFPHESTEELKCTNLGQIRSTNRIFPNPFPNRPLTHQQHLWNIRQFHIGRSQCEHANSRQTSREPLVKAFHGEKAMITLRLHQTFASTSSTSSTSSKHPKIHFKKIIANKMFRCFVLFFWKLKKFLETSKRKSSISSLHPKQMLEISTFVWWWFCRSRWWSLGPSDSRRIAAEPDSSKDRIFFATDFCFKFSAECWMHWNALECWNCLTKIAELFGCFLSLPLCLLPFFSGADGSSSSHEASVDDERTSFHEPSQFQSSHEPNATANEHRGNGSLIQAHSRTTWHLTKWIIDYNWIIQSAFRLLRQHENNA